MVKKTNQQNQTKDYFDKSAKEWQKKSNSLNIKIPVIQQRNSYVFDHVKKSKYKIKKFLDVGCGTGELVHQVSKRNIFSKGIDFSEKMIDNCNKYSNKNAQFICTDILNYKSDMKFDLISANGFIEYISLIELNKFLKNTKKILKKNGHLIFSVRNRLFNIFSLNKFTEPELKLSTSNKLLNESLFFSNIKKFKSLEKLPKIDFQNKNFSHTHTGIGVASRFQYTPSQINRILSKYKFQIIDLAGVNTHILPRNLVHKNREKNQMYFDINQPFIFGSLSNIPFSSTFMVKAKSC